MRLLPAWHRGWRHTHNIAHGLLRVMRVRQLDAFIYQGSSRKLIAYLPRNEQVSKYKVQNALCRQPYGSESSSQETTWVWILLRLQQWCGIRLGCDGVFVRSGIFKSRNPKKRAQAIVNGDDAL